MAKRNKIEVLAAPSQATLESKGAWIGETCDTIQEAKRRARYFLTEDWMNRIESTTKMGYSQVLVNGEVHSDYFGETPEAQYSAQLHGRARGIHHHGAPRKWLTEDYRGDSRSGADLFKRSG